MSKAPMRTQLKTIERYSYLQSVGVATLVRKNYESIIARKDKEIEELKAKVDTLRFPF